jgi:hypothetical protein
MSTSAAAMPRSLADQLRSWPEARVARLLEGRPDLASPAPQDSAQLASRAGTRASIGRVLDRLTVLELSTLEAVVASGPTSSLEQVRALVYADPAVVASTVERLQDVALVWGTPDELRVLGPVPDLLGSQSLLGLGVEALLSSYGPARIASLVTAVGVQPTGDRASDMRTIAVRLSVPAVVERLVDSLDPKARAILDHLERTGADGTIGAAGEPTDQLLGSGLLIAKTTDRVAVPREVAVSLRGGHLTREPVDVPPALATSGRDPRLVDRTAGHAAFEFVRHTELLLETWGTNPPPGLRQGGLAVRELRTAAQLLHVEDRAAALIIEIAAAAGLLGMGATDVFDQAWLPTDAFDLWNTASTSQRWVTLATAWRDNPRLTGLIGGRLNGKPVNALAPELERPGLREARRTALQLVADLPPGEVLAATTGLPSLLALNSWHRPRQPKNRSDAVMWAVEEAAAIGVTALGGVSTHGRALLGDDPEAVVAVLEPLLPTAVEQVMVQADLTAVAPGPLSQELGRDLAVVADVESRGGATTYRFTEQSVRRAFDSGWSTAEIHGFLASASSTPIPQALEYLVNDVARRFGNVRVGMAECFLRSDDEAVLTTLVHDQRAASLRLRRIAPTVVVSDVPLDVLLPRLRELGVSPVVEAADGTVRVVRRDEYRARTPRSAGVVSNEARDAARTTARVTATVRAIRSGDRAAEVDTSRLAPVSPASLLGSLREATESGRTVWIGYVDNHGATTERVVDPLRVDAGRLWALDHRTDEQRSFALHRITGVRLL